MENVLDKRSREKSEHISCSVIFFPENHAVYDIMWKYGRVRQATDKNII
jgi:hypothetical protein